METLSCEENVVVQKYKEGLPGGENGVHKSRGRKIFWQEQAIDGPEIDSIQKQSRCLVCLCVPRTQHMINAPRGWMDGMNE